MVCVARRGQGSRVRGFCLCAYLKPLHKRLKLQTIKKTEEEEETGRTEENGNLAVITGSACFCTITITLNFKRRLKGQRSSLEN